MQKDCCYSKIVYFKFIPVQRIASAGCGIMQALHKTKTSISRQNVKLAFILYRHNSTTTLVLIQLCLCNVSLYSVIKMHLH
jgi:hypothetical protein